MLYPLQDIKLLCEWVADPKNLGIDRVTEFVLYLTVNNPDSPTTREVLRSSLESDLFAPITLELDMMRWRPASEMSIKVQSTKKLRRNNPDTGILEIQTGIPDEVIFQRALREIDNFDTLVLISSDMDFPIFAEELRNGINRFLPGPSTKKQRRATTREVVNIGSAAKISPYWTSKASNYVLIEDMITPRQLETTVANTLPA